MNDEPARDDKDAADLAAIRQGGPTATKAVTRLYQSYRRPLLGYFMRKGVDAAEAEDLLQEVFISVTRQAGSFRGESKVSTWIYRIAENRFIDQVRRKKPEDQVDDEAWGKVADTLAHDQSNPGQAVDDCVSRALQQFARQSSERAEALRRVALDDWSIDDLAHFLGRTNAATREYLSQTRKKVREFMQPCLELLGGAA